VRHDLGLENIVTVTRMERVFDRASLPVPQNNPPIVRTGHQNVPISVEADSVDTTPVLLQFPEHIKSKDKIL